jgi:hypothetical protein
MGCRALAIALAGIVFTSLGAVACLGYGTPIDESEINTKLPERADIPDSAPVVDDPPTISTPIPEAGADTSPPVDAAKTPLRVFVSSAVKTGNLGGIAAADQLCTTLATTAKLGGTYRAWLSVAGADAVDHITSAGPWQLVSGEIVADDKAGLTSGALKHLIDKDENGATPPVEEDRAWTGTGANGRYAGPDCAQWAGGGNGLVGEARNNANGQWGALGNEACGEQNRIYCFEL